MTGKVLEIESLIQQDYLARAISQMWDTWASDRNSKVEEWRELRNYLFATDTTKTTNSKLPWKNKTTLPKLTQIRDNLHANYMAALFPSDEWLVWEGNDYSAVSREKRMAIEAYMRNKLKQIGFEDLNSRLLYDFIDYGNCFGETVYRQEYRIDEITEEMHMIYNGPEINRISPLDIVFNPTASTFRQTPKIIRKLKSLGELEQELLEHPELRYNKEVIAKMKDARMRCASLSPDDWNKVDAYNVDGFGSLYDYLQSNYVELLEFRGSIHDEDGKLERNRIITVVDRRYVVRDEQNPSWLGNDGIFMAGWRYRPDNLWAMGPLDNLVGMQYRIDHLENIKADALDLAVMPPLKVKGNVEAFTWGPGEVIFIGDDGDVGEMGMNLQAVINADNQIAALEVRMEQFVGAPREAMGIRTPGEKTAFEVQHLENAASRIFYEKVRSYEINFLEPAINSMLEIAKNSFGDDEIVKIDSNDSNLKLFKTISKEDIVGNGKLVPMGARHFAANAQLVQNLNSLFGSAAGALVAPHTSSKELTKTLEDALGLEKYQIFKNNAQLFEQAETQKLAQQITQGMEEAAMTPGPEELYAEGSSFTEDEPEAGIAPPQGGGAVSQAGV
jgi:hypothetical protein